MKKSEKTSMHTMTRTANRLIFYGVHTLFHERDKRKSKV